MVDYGVCKDQKTCITDLRAIYNAPHREGAAVALDQLEQNWGILLKQFVTLFPGRSKF